MTSAGARKGWRGLEEGRRRPRGKGPRQRRAKPPQRQEVLCRGVRAFVGVSWPPWAKQAKEGTRRRRPRRRLGGGHPTQARERTHTLASRSLARPVAADRLGHNTHARTHTRASPSEHRESPPSGGTHARRAGFRPDEAPRSRKNCPGYRNDHLEPWPLTLGTTLPPSTLLPKMVGKNKGSIVAADTPCRIPVVFCFFPPFLLLLSFLSLALAAWALSFSFSFSLVLLVGRTVVAFWLLRLFGWCGPSHALEWVAARDGGSRSTLRRCLLLGPFCLTCRGLIWGFFEKGRLRLERQSTLYICFKGKAACNADVRMAPKLPSHQFSPHPSEARCHPRVLLTKYELIIVCKRKR